MNPWHLSASELMIWGIVLHLIADWPLQNDWMAKNKMKRANLGEIPGDGLMTAPSRMHTLTYWWVRHPAAFVHAGIHTIFLALIFGWAAIFLGFAHLIIDCRWIIVWWSTKVIKQTQPTGANLYQNKETEIGYIEIPLVDVGLEVRFWTDQVFHIACIAVAALLVTL